MVRAENLHHPDGTFDLLYNGYMFGLIPLEGFQPILKEFNRVLKPGGKLVLMSSYLEPAGFTAIQRFYRPSRGVLVSRLWGQEIVLAQKPV